MKILVADDHVLFREGLSLQLAQMEGGADIFEAGDFGEALKLAAGQEDLDLALIDLGMPGMDWREAIQTFLNRFPEVPIVVVSASDDHRTIMEAIEIGVAGYIPKSSTGNVMLSALKLVLSGGTYLPPELLSKAAESPGATAGSGDNTKSLLTPRQFEVMGLMGKGCSNKEIARALDLSEGTVKVHVTAILKALDANNRTQAVLAAARFGLTPSLR